MVRAVVNRRRIGIRSRSASNTRPSAVPDSSPKRAQISSKVPLGNDLDHDQRKRKRERGIALFAIIYLEEMVRGLEKAYDAGWSGAQSSA
jgi:hypothetical protein